MAINIFMVALMGRVLGLAELSPVASVVAGLVLGVSATWVTARWIRGVMDRADGRR